MKLPSFRLLVIPLVILLSVSLLFSGTTGKIAGRVSDKSNGEPLPFANIIIVGTSVGAVSDVNGDYFILNIPPGIYTVQARMMGYSSVSMKSVKVKIDQTSRVNLELPMEVIKMPETIIYGKKIIEPDVTTSKKEYSGKQIERMAVRNPVEALLTSTSMVRDPRRGEIHVRGGRGGEVLYLIDGMEVRDPLVGGGLGIRVEDNEVNEMAMLTGGYNAEYGNAQSGIVNIVTREGDVKAHTVRMSYENDRTLVKQDFDFYGRAKNSFNNDKAVFSLGGPEPISKYILPVLGVKVPWDISYYISSTGDWNDTYTPFPDRSFLTTYLLWDKIRLKDRMSNIYTGNSKIACRFSSTAKLSLGYRKSWEKRFDYSNSFKYIPENAYRRTRDSYQTVADWNQTLSGRTFYTIALSYFRTAYTRTPGGKTPDQINQYPTTSDNPIDIIIGYPGLDGRDEPFRDVSRFNGVYNFGEQFIDLNKNGFWDEGEPFTDMAQRNYHYDRGEDFRDYNGDAIWTGTEPYSDWGMDGIANTHDSLEGNGKYDEGPWGHEPFEDYNFNSQRDDPEGDQFYDYGFDQWAVWQKRYTNALTFKTDVTSQITNSHLVKTGFEYKRYTMSMQEIQYPWYKEPNRDPPPPGPWPDRGYFRDFYTRHPSSGAYYIQDKIETKGMIINAGLRFDFIYPGSEVSGGRDETPFLGLPLMTEYEARLSPRFGISFPISEFDKLYFSYGHFSQAPEYQYFYEDTTQFSSAIRLYGNPNLHSEKTIAYQLGVVHAIGSIVRIEFKGFYKDIRDLIDTEARGISPFTYQVRVNKDYGSVRGVEINFEKRLSHFYSFSLDYSLQWAMGKSSSDRQGYDYSYRGIPLPLREYPLDWDQRHSVTNMIDLRSASGEHPVVFGLSLPDKWDVNVLTQMSTGLPYTPSGETGGEDVTILPNSARKPFTTTTDMKAKKFFYLGPIRYEFMVEVMNVFDRSNILTVYSATGRPDVSDPDDIEYNPDGSVKAVHGTEYDRNPQNWGPRREIYFGFALSYGL